VPQQSCQVVARQQFRVLWPLQEGADVIADGRHVERLQTIADEITPLLRVTGALSLCLVECVLQYLEARLNRGGLRPVPHEIVLVPALGVLAGDGGMQLSCQQRR